MLGGALHQVTARRSENSPPDHLTSTTSRLPFVALTTTLVTPVFLPVILSTDLTPSDTAFGPFTEAIAGFEDVTVTFARPTPSPWATKGSRTVRPGATLSVLVELLKPLTTAGWVTVTGGWTNVVGIRGAPNRRSRRPPRSPSPARRRSGSGTGCPPASKSPAAAGDEPSLVCTTVRVEPDTDALVRPDVPLRHRRRDRGSPWSGRTGWSPCSCTRPGCCAHGCSRGRLAGLGFRPRHADLEGRRSR